MIECRSDRAVGDRRSRLTIAANSSRLEPSYERLLSRPEVGPPLGAVLAAETDQIGRFVAGPREV